MSRVKGTRGKTKGMTDRIKARLDQVDIQKGKAENETANFVNADGVTSEEMESWDFDTFLQAIVYEEQQESISTGIKIVGVTLLIVGVYYGWKYVKKHKIVPREALFHYRFCLILLYRNRKLQARAYLR